MATSSSTISKQGSPSFFKVLRDPSSPHLSLPSAFVRRHLKKIPKKPILKTVNGEHSWRLKIKKLDGDYFFALGWNKFVQDFKLDLGDFLVFWLIDPSTFQVLIFRRDGCEKDPPSNWSRKTTSTLNLKTAIKIEDVDVDVDDDDDDDDDDVDDILDENPCFQRAISEKTHKYTMALPRKFVEEAGFSGKRVLTMKDLKGRQWLVGLFVETYDTTKYMLSSGWSIFREHNELSGGDICLFKFIKKEGILALAQVIKNKNPIKQESPKKKTPEVEGVKRKRGRPPLQKPHGDKIEEKSVPEVEAVRRKRGRPSLGKRDGGGGVKIEVESDAEVEVVNKQRGKLSVGKPDSVGGGGGSVKIEVESDADAKVEVMKRKRGRPRLEKPSVGGVEVKTDESTPQVEVEVVKRKRGRPCLESYNRCSRVVYF